MNRSRCLRASRSVARGAVEPVPAHVVDHRLVDHRMDSRPVPARDARAHCRRAHRVRVHRRVDCAGKGQFPDLRARGIARRLGARARPECVAAFLLYITTWAVTSPAPGASPTRPRRSGLPGCSIRRRSRAGFRPCGPRATLPVSQTKRGGPSRTIASPAALRAPLTGWHPPPLSALCCGSPCPHPHAAPAAPPRPPPRPLCKHGSRRRVSRMPPTDTPRHGPCSRAWYPQRQQHRRVVVAAIAR